MIPVGIIGFAFKDQIDTLFNGKIVLVGVMLLVTGALLYLTQYASTKHKDGRKVSFKDALIIGIAQAVAVLPGMSRSGSTIATGLLLGVDKSKICSILFLNGTYSNNWRNVVRIKRLYRTTCCSNRYASFSCWFCRCFYFWSFRL